VQTTGDSTLAEQREVGGTTAHDLAISVFQLFEWSWADQPARAAGVAVPTDSKESLQDENERLRAELVRNTVQRDTTKAD
jgi:transposase